MTQVLDYASAIASMTYEQFDAAIIRVASGAAIAPKSLYAIIADQPDPLDEAASVDAVAMNLRRGRMLVIAAGHGVRREAETLATPLQGHAGAHFTFAMVELAAYVQKNGRLQTGTVGWQAPEDAALRYVGTLASIIGGSVGDANGWFHKAIVDGKTLPLIERLLPTHAEEWRTAIGVLLDDLRKTAAAEQA